MKTVTIALVTFLLLMSCEEENMKPADYFSGSWHFSDPDVPIDIAFDAVRINNGAYNLENRIVNHPAIPEDQRRNNNIFLYDKFADGSGYGKIEILSRGSFLYIVTLIYNRIDEEGMQVYDIQIDIPSEPFIILHDRVFERRND